MVNLKPTYNSSVRFQEIDIPRFLSVWLYFFHFSLLEFICREDFVAENLTAMFYLFSGGAFLYVASRFRFRSLWCWGYVLLFLLIAGEEISWGQRVLGIKTPEVLVSMNVQKEISLHNLQGIHGTVRAAALSVVLLICFAIPISEKLFGLACISHHWASAKLPLVA